MNLIRNLFLLCLFVLSTVGIQFKANAAASTYGLSCTNTAYGTQLGGVYLEFNTLTTFKGDGNTYGMYTSTDCVYGGAGRTNSSAIVGGEIARAAANAVVGAVSSRLNAAMNMNADTAAHMSYSANGGGVGMAANHIIGGLSLWTSFSSSDFDNDQTFTNLSRDTNQYTGNAESLSIGVDKAIGNMVIGINYASFNSDIDTKANGGTIDAEGETYGLYAGLNTGAIMISAGAGVGDYSVDTNRKDLGTGSLGIKGTDIDADVEYYFLNISGAINRGKLSFSPRVGIRSFELDVPAFTDIVPNDSNSGLGTTDTSTANESIAAKTYSSDMSEAGISVALAAGTKLIPYLDIAYVSEDTTKAAYSTELKDDSVTELAASDPSGYTTFGGGIILNISSKVSGYLNVTETTGREDYNETSISGSFRIKF